MPIREAHGRPPDIPNLQRQGSTTWEPVSVILKTQVHAHQVQRSIFDEGTCTCPDPWPNLGAVIVNPDTYFRSALQLEGEQNINLPCVGSELHAAPPAPQNFQSLLSPSPPIPSPSDTLVCENPSHGEGIATEWHTTETRSPEPLKLPGMHGGDLQETGGVPSVLGNSPAFPENIDPFGLAGADKKVDARGVEPLHIDAHKQGGAPLLVVGTAPALAKDTVGIGPADKAETASTAKPKALVSWAQEDGHRHEVNAQPHEALPQKGKHKAEALPRRCEQCLNEANANLFGCHKRHHEGTRGHLRCCH